MTKLKPNTACFLAFTGIFAVLAGFVFWGAWSVDYAPVMPDHPILWPPDAKVRLGRWLEEFFRTGRCEPLEIFTLAGSPYWWQEFKYAVCLYLSGLGMAYFRRGKGLLQNQERLIPRLAKLAEHSPLSAKLCYYI